MYRIYDTQSAIREVQIYLSLVGNTDVLVAPNGIYDDNTRLSVSDFQLKEGLAVTGEVDRATFELLYEKYVIAVEKARLNNAIDSFVSFPIFPGFASMEMIHINETLGRLMSHYGFNHNLRASSFYSSETEIAVSELRTLYRLMDKNYIDEIFYIRMIKDHNSIALFADIFN